MKFEDHNPDIEVVGFVVHADGTFEFANPCAVPLEFLEEAINAHKKKDPKKDEVTVVSFIKIPFNLKAMRKKK